MVDPGLLRMASVYRRKIDLTYVFGILENISDYSSCLQISKRHVPAGTGIPALLNFVCIKSPHFSPISIFFPYVCNGSAGRYTHSSSQL